MRKVKQRIVYKDLPINAIVPSSKSILYKYMYICSKAKASMLNDLEQGRKTEIDFINGTIVKVR